MIGRDEMAAIGRETLELYKKAPEKAGDVVFRMTSGTTGRSPIITLMTTAYMTHPVYRDWYMRAARVITCYGTLVYRHYQALAESRREPTGRALALDLADLDESLRPILADYRPDAFIGNPSFMLRIGEFCDEETRLGVVALKCIGERVSKELQRALNEFFPRAFISGIYMTSELGPISKPTCVKRTPEYFHPRDDITIEIDEPDDTGAGDMLVSGTVLASIRVDKYRIGDVVREVGPCPCGDARTYESLGRRGYDFLKLGGALVTQAEFDRTTRLFPHLIADYRAEVSRVSDGGRLVGKIVLFAQSSRAKPSTALQKEIAETISNELFLTLDKTLHDLVERREFLPLEIVWQSEPFPLTSKVVKLRSV